MNKLQAIERGQNQRNLCALKERVLYKLLRKIAPKKYSHAISRNNRRVLALIYIYASINIAVLYSACIDPPGYGAKRESILLRFMTSNLYNIDAVTCFLGGDPKSTVRCTKGTNKELRKLG